MKSTIEGSTEYLAGSQGSKESSLWDGCTPSADVTDAAAVRGLPPLYVLVPLVISVVVHHTIAAWSFSLPTIGALAGDHVRILAGIAVVLLGAAIQAHGIVSFKRSGNSIGPHSPTNSIMRDGAFAYSRNPLYMGTLVSHAGIAIALGSVWTVASVVIAIVLLHYWAVRPEERYLDAKFGEEYRAYKGQVRRWC